MKRVNRVRYLSYLMVKQLTLAFTVLLLSSCNNSDLARQEINDEESNSSSSDVDTQHYDNQDSISLESTSSINVAPPVSSNIQTPSLPSETDKPAEESNNENNDVNDTVSTQSPIENTSIAGLISPFEKVSFKIDGSSKFIKIQYQEQLSGRVVSQPSFKNSSDEFTILAIPLSAEGVNTYRVSNSEQTLGTIDILPNSMIAQNSAPGQYSLTVLNSILIGLRDDLSKFTEYLLNSGSTGKSIENIIPVQRAITNFEELVSRVGYAVSTGSSIIDPQTDQILIENSDLESLDGIFHHIVTRYSSDEYFVSQAYSLIQEQLQSGRSEFNLIFSATKHQLENWDGIAALASLKIIPMGSANNSDLLSLNNVLDVVKAALIPAILANEINDMKASNGETHIDEAIRLFNKVESESSQTSNFIFKNALSALLDASLEINNN